MKRPREPVRLDNPVAPEGASSAAAEQQREQRHAEVLGALVMGAASSRGPEQPLTGAFVLPTQRAVVRQRGSRTGGLLFSAPPPSKKGPDADAEDGAAVCSGGVSSQDAARMLLAELGCGTSQEQRAADAAHLERVQGRLGERRKASSISESLFARGAPQIDPLNKPFFALPSIDAPMVDAKTIDQLLSKLHHPLTSLAGSLLEAEVAGRVPPPPPIVMHKTPQERQQERHAQRLAKREQHQQAVKSGQAAEAQRLTERHLNTVLAQDFIANPLATTDRVHAAAAERERKHQEANFERHVAALPGQIQRREERLLTKAETDAVLSIYRVFPIREESSLGMFVKFANDHRLRGFVAWIDQRDALIVLMGGPAPQRHLHTWIAERMNWRGSADTKAALVYTTRVQRQDRFSFHEVTEGAPVSAAAAAAAGSAGSSDAAHVDVQRVYLKSFKNVAAAEDFFVRVMPTSGPWPSLEVLWRAAMDQTPEALLTARQAAALPPPAAATPSAQAEAAAAAFATVAVAEKQKEQQAPSQSQVNATAPPAAPTAVAEEALPAPADDASYEALWNDMF